MPPAEAPSRFRLLGLLTATALAASAVGLAPPAAAAEVTAPTDPASPSAAATPPKNRPPQAVADVVRMQPNQSVAVNALANDTDPDGDKLTLVAASSPKPSVVGVKVAGGKLVVHTARNATGSVALSYRIADPHGATSTGRVTVTVVAPKPAPNHAPVARPDKATVTAGTTSKITVLANDSDPDGDKLSLSVVGKASAGTARRSGSKIRYTAPGKPGTAKVSYAVKDARGAGATGVLTITIKAKPKPKPAPKPKPKPKPKAPTKTQVEKALKNLGLPTGKANGVYDGATRRAVCAWRTIVGKRATRSLPSSSEAKSIVGMNGLPKARSWMVSGVNVSITCQAAFWVKGERYKRVMAACSGKSGYRTRIGTFRVFRSFTTWRYSTIYPEARMYKPMQFSGGQALHGSSTDRLVKTYPASHGCVRMLHKDIDAMHNGGLGLGTRVKVVGSWKG